MTLNTSTNACIFSTLTCACFLILADESPLAVIWSRKRIALRKLALRLRRRNQRRNLITPTDQTALMRMVANGDA
jgi:hypothetical protein